MKFWIMALRTFGYIWLTIAAIIIVAGIYGVWVKEGFSAVQDLLSPFNVINWLATIITVAPGVGAILLAGKLKSKKREG